MTWHPLATNPLPEPREGQVLLLRLNPDKPRVYTTLAGNSDGWHTDIPWSRDALQSKCERNHPHAQWFLVPAPGEQSESAAAASELEDLVSQAIRNAGRRESTHRARWAWVTEVFAVGSTRAHELCRRFGLDPDETVGGKS